MLVLSRRTRDSIIIGHDVTVTVLSISRDHVRLGIQAPADIEVHREEVYRAIQEANRRAAASSSVGTEALAGLLSQRPAPGAGDPSPEAPTPRGPATAPGAAASGDAQGVRGTATP